MKHQGLGQGSDITCPLIFLFNMWTQPEYVDIDHGTDPSAGPGNLDLELQIPHSNSSNNYPFSSLVSHTLLAIANNNNDNNNIKCIMS